MAQLTFGFQDEPGRAYFLFWPANPWVHHTTCGKLSLSPRMKTGLPALLLLPPGLAVRGLALGEGPLRC